MIGAVILAAGESRRMGEAKQLLDWNGEPMIRHAVRNVLAAGFDVVRVVSGACADEVRSVLEDLPVEVLYNSRYSEGQSTSLHQGLQGLPGEMLGVAFILGDQPLIRCETLKQLLAYFRLHRPGILIPTYQGQRGNPVFFHRELYPSLLQVTGDQGGREIIRENPDRVKLLEVNDPGIRIDIDNRADYQHYLNLTRKIAERISIEGGEC